VAPSTPRYEQEETDAAAAEAAGIGGVSGEEELDLDPAQLPVTEAGGGVSEGFEEAERALIEHASHGDQQSAHTILHDQGLPEEPDGAREDSEPDHERSSELDDDG
jgi:hypothetical protein